jgi:RNA binding exosome subunit
MLYRIYIDQRLDKQKAVIEAVKELTSDFIILKGMAYFGNNHRPCQIIEVGFENASNIKSCIDKLKKILGTPTIMVAQYGFALKVLY